MSAAPDFSVLSRLTLLALRDNRLDLVSAVLPPTMVQNLVTLDLSGNFWGDDHAYLTRENLMAFVGRFDNLQVVGLRPHPLHIGTYPANLVKREALRG